MIILHIVGAYLSKAISIPNLFVAAFPFLCSLEMIHTQQMVSAGPAMVTFYVILKVLSIP